MIAVLLRPFLSWLAGQLIKVLLQAMGRDLRQRLPEVFAVIDHQILPAMQAGSRSVALLFFTAVQCIVKRDPTDLELRILQLLFDPYVAASRNQAHATDP